MMHYRQDKKNISFFKKKSFVSFAIIILFASFILSNKTTRNLGGRFVYFVSRPFYFIGHSVSNGFSSYVYLLKTKHALENHNNELKADLEGAYVRLQAMNLTLEENNKLKEILGRKISGKNFVLANIVAKPGNSSFDTLILDAGEKDGVKAGSTIFVDGSIAVGSILEVYPSSSKAILYSAPDQKTSIVLADAGISGDLVGRGGGNFEIILPRETPIVVGDTATLPTIDSTVVANVESSVSDPSDPFQKVLLSSPVNIQTQKWVEIEK